MRKKQGKTSVRVTMGFMAKQLIEFMVCYRAILILHLIELMVRRLVKKSQNIFKKLVVYSRICLQELGED
jgi:hypothetical protein